MASTNVIRNMQGFSFSVPILNDSVIPAHVNITIKMHGADNTDSTPWDIMEENILPGNTLIFTGNASKTFMSGLVPQVYQLRFIVKDFDTAKIYVDKTITDNYITLIEPTISISIGTMTLNAT